MIDLIDAKCGDKVYSLEDWSQRPIEWTIKEKIRSQTRSPHLFISDGHYSRTIYQYEFHRYFPTAVEAVVDAIAALDRKVSAMQKQRQRLVADNADVLADGAILEVLT